jgi:hypothetical protein
LRTKKNIYRRFVEFEEQAAEIYLRLTSRFSADNPNLSAVWFDMAMQEKQHAGLLQFCLADGLFAADLPSEGEIQMFAKRFRDFQKRAADPNLDVNGAFELAAELEGSEVNAIYCYLTMPLHASSYLLKRKTVTSPLAHVNELATAGKRFGVAPQIQKKLNSLKDSCENSFFSAVKRRSTAV